MEGLSQILSKMLTGQAVSVIGAFVALVTFAILAVGAKYIGEYAYGKRPIKNHKRVIQSLESALAESILDREETYQQSECYRLLLIGAIKQRNEADWQKLTLERRVRELEKIISNLGYVLPKRLGEEIDWLI